MNHNLFALFRSRFPDDHTQPLIETENNQRISYADFDAATARYARFLSDLGLNKGDRVLVQVDKSPQLLFFYLGCIRAGLIYLPLNTAYRRSELAHFFNDAEPSVVLGSSGTIEILNDLAHSAKIKPVFTLEADGSGSLQEAIQNTGPDFKIAENNADDVAAILYTSGTTGRPKGAMLSHDNLGSNALALEQAWGWRKDDVLLHALPLYHTHGLFVACHCVLLGGSRMIFLPRFDPETAVELLPHCTVFMGVPTYYTRLLSYDGFDARACRNMRLFISGSAPLLEQTFREFEQRTGRSILERYGMTETGMNTSNPLDGRRIAGTVGTPLPGVEARIVDDRDQDIEPGAVGQLLVKGPNVFKGYWRMPEKNAEEFTADGFFRTGDLASYGEDGYIAIVGRGKDLIISGGLNVYPKEVERAIDDIDGVVESAVIGLPHLDFGESVNAAVVLADNRDDISAEFIIGVLKEKLAGFKVPKAVFIVDDLPRNAMGKVQKNVLREKYS